MTKAESKARANIRQLRKVAGMEAVADSLERLLDGASEGGRARAKKLSPKRRSEIARDAANARWAKPTKGKR